MRKYKCSVIVPDSYEPLLAGDSATLFFFDTDMGQIRSVDAEVVEEDKNGQS